MSDRAAGDTYRTERIPTRSADSVGGGRPGSSVGRMGMWLLLASLGVLFTACLVGFLVVRMRAPVWPPPGSPSLPGGLWVSTMLLVVLSLSLVLAERAVRAGREASLVRWLSVSVLLSLAFLGAQVSNWMRMAAGETLPAQSLFVWGFYVLTFLHAAHVIFGLVPLVLVTLRARRGAYTADSSEGIHLVALYWHFLLVTWIAVFAVMSF